MSKMDDLDYNTLIDSFVMTSLGDILDSIDKSGLMRRLAELLYIHKMPVREIYPFLIDYGKMARKKEES